MYTLHNIEMFAQGFYQLRLYMAHGEVSSCCLTHEQDLQPSATEHSITQPLIVGQKYLSKVFYIRYAEEKVNLGEIIKFKSSQDEKVTLQIELWFLEATTEEINMVNAPRTMRTSGALECCSVRVL